MLKEHLIIKDLKPKKSKKNITLNIEEEMLHKFKLIAEANNQSYNKFFEYLVESKYSELIKNR